MKSAPVYYTVGQIQHNPLLNLSSYVPEIQERMRKAGFPDFQRATQLQFDLAKTTGDSGHLTPPIVQGVDRFQFSDVLNTKCFVLQPNGLSFQTTEYETFEPFLENLKLGLDILGEAVGGLAFVERIGLRYLDAVVPAPGESLAQYLVAQVLGVPATIQSRMPEATFAYSFAESLLVAQGVGQVVARTVIRSGPVGFAADMQPEPLKLSERFRAVNGEHAVLDTDGSFTERQPFEVTAVDGRLRQLHDLIDSVFRSTVSEHALKVWGPGDEE